MQVDNVSSTPLPGIRSRVEGPETIVPRKRPEHVAHSETASEVAAEKRAERPPEEVPRPIDEREVDKVVELANELARRMDVKILFRKSDETDEFRLEVVNRETGELIRTVPPEEMVARLENFSGFEGLLTGSGG